MKSWSTATRAIHEDTPRDPSHRSAVLTPPLPPDILPTPLAGLAQPALGSMLLAPPAATAGPAEAGLSPPRLPEEGLAGPDPAEAGLRYLTSRLAEESPPFSLPPPLVRPAPRCPDRPDGAVLDLCTASIGRCIGRWTTPCPAPPHKALAPTTPLAVPTLTAAPADIDLFPPDNAGPLGSADECLLSYGGRAPFAAAALPCLPADAPVGWAEEGADS